MSVVKYIADQAQKAPAKQAAVVAAAQAKQNQYDAAHGQRLYAPPPGGPMSFAPPYGQGMRGPTTQMPTQPGPNTMQLGSTNGGYQYAPNPFSGQTPMQPPLQPAPTPGRMQPNGAQPNPQLANQQAQIAVLRGQQG